MIHIPSNTSEQRNTGRLCQVYLHFPVSLLVVETCLDLAYTETEGVATNTRVERVGGT